MNPDLKRKLEEAESFGDVFQVVKRAVRDVLGVRRAGLELVLMDLPGEIGAMHQIGSNAIIMNKKVLQVLLKSSKPKEEINAYIFSILLHEYLHSLGILDETETRNLAIKVAKETFGENHIAYKITSKDLLELYRSIKREVSHEVSGKPEIVEDFDTDNTQYIT